jgi:hypothetical protein
METTDRICPDHTSARCAIRHFTVSSIRQDIFELIRERSRMRVNSPAAQNDSHDPTNSPDTRGYTTTPTQEGVTSPTRDFNKLFRMEWSTALLWLPCCRRQTRRCRDQRQPLLSAHQMCHHHMRLLNTILPPQVSTHTVGILAEAVLGEVLIMGKAATSTCLFKQPQRPVVQMGH